MNPEDEQPAQLRDESQRRIALPATDEWPGFVDEFCTRQAATPELMDELWGQGWRHFGPLFFRYSLYPSGNQLRVVLPLRVALDRFQPSRSQRRILARNQDCEVRYQPPRLDAERRELFARHKRRFQQNIPEALEDFLGPAPGVV